MSGWRVILGGPAYRHKLPPVPLQVGVHEQYGGVKPDAAQAAHKENIDKSVEAALQKAGLTSGELSAVAVTVGPGLGLCLEVGIKKVCVQPCA